MLNNYYYCEMSTFPAHAQPGNGYKKADKFARACAKEKPKPEQEGQQLLELSKIKKQSE